MNQGFHVSIKELRAIALDAAVGFLQTAKDPDHTTTHLFRMLKHIDSSELSQRGFMDLVHETDHQLNLNDRYDPTWPSPEERRSAPPASLAACLQRRLDAEQLEELPPSVSESHEDWEYLANRLRRTHDFHHLVLGLPDTVAGEAVASAYYACRYRSPGALAVMTTWIAHGLIQPAENQLIWRCVEFGIQLAQELPISLLSVRWEEHWDRSLITWREQLGLTTLLARSPLVACQSQWLPASSSDHIQGARKDQ